MTGHDDGTRWGELADDHGAITVALPDDDPIGTQILLGVYRHQPEIELALDLVRSEDIVLDIGAHLGIFALPAAKRGAQVIAIEAGPINARFLRASASANDFARLTVVQAAAGNTDGPVRFREHGPWGHQSPNVYVDDVAVVPGRTVTGILAEHGVERVDLIKLDIEGGELDVLADLEAMLRADSAPELVIEANRVTQRERGARVADLLRPLEEWGFTLWQIHGRTLTRRTAADFQPETVGNYWATKGIRPAPTGWSRRDERSDDEIAETVRTQAQSDFWFVRAALAEDLANAGALLGHPIVRQCFARLVLDPEELVARATMWWTHGDGRDDEPLAARFELLRDLAEALDAIARESRARLSPASAARGESS